MFKRRIEGWGIPRLHPNGTMELSPGMVKDVASGSADLIIASLSIMYERYLSDSHVILWQGSEFQ